MTEPRPGSRREPAPEPHDDHARRGRHEAEPSESSAAGSASPGEPPAAGRHEAPGRREASTDVTDAEAEALRRLFRETVGDLEPGADSLENLRLAVPMRRRRRRHVLLGTAASVALLSIGAPLMASVADSDGGQDSAMDTSNGGGPPGSWGDDTGRGDPGAPSPTDGAEPGRLANGGAGDGETHPFDVGEPGEGDPTDARETLGLTSPSCLREQLGQVAADTEPADGNGRIYGVIRMVNVSDEPCRVTGDGELAVLSDSAGGTAVRVVDRTEGDRATRLPTPDEAHEELILPPGEGYEVRFAWVPDGGMSISGCAVAASPAEDGGSTISPQLRRNDPEASTGEGGSGDDGGDAAGADSAGADGSGGSDGSGDAEGSGSSGDVNGSGDADGSESVSGGAGGSGSGGGSGNGGSGDDGGTDEGAGGVNEGAGGAGGAGGSDPGGPGGGSGDSGSTPPSDSSGSGGESAGVVLRYTPAAGEPEAARILLDGTCAGTVYRTGVLTATG
ncbi:hypothetical protein SAMN06297387_13321 [Streptomyces zhaozhouensis]|uniref:DUF4232 domain-containing protein n=1 Tax=Streptomyces zhaozhouensis TaxID=1300267 RepID=A0A286E9Y5_9ACTN|nr:DUF4232 domain-containing protein [Streptomyces zhaozhouensis]SOD67721.1 hypothetical protein SAMN06297387_13321 [Streptomyces zhaozhouensis]